MSFCWGNQITIGELIKQLKKCRVREGHSGVFFDFCNFVPKKDIYSYRGFYEDIALEVDPTYQFPSSMGLQEFIELLEDQIGKPHYGYKGGEYITRNDTPIWVTPSHDATGDTVITGVDDQGYMVIIKTENARV